MQARVAVNRQYNADAVCCLPVAGLCTFSFLDLVDYSAVVLIDGLIMKCMLLS